jgi:hypothetical protein
MRLESRLDQLMHRVMSTSVSLRCIAQVRMSGVKEITAVLKEIFRVCADPRQLGHIKQKRK